MQVLPLTGSHKRLGFDCGQQELNDCLLQVARQHQDKGLSKTFVAALEEVPDRICGYYALTLAELENRQLRARFLADRARSSSGRQPDRRARREAPGSPMGIVGPWKLSIGIRLIMPAGSGTASATL